MVEFEKQMHLQYESAESGKIAACVDDIWICISAGRFNRGRRVACTRKARCSSKMINDRWKSELIALALNARQDQRQPLAVWDRPMRTSRVLPRSSQLSVPSFLPISRAIGWVEGIYSTEGREQGGSAAYRKLEAGKRGPLAVPLFRIAHISPLQSYPPIKHLYLNSSWSH